MSAPSSKFSLSARLLLGAMGLAWTSSTTWAGSKGLLDTTQSADAKMYMTDLGDIHWTGGLWSERFDVCRYSMIPGMWKLFQSEPDSHAWANFLTAAGEGATVADKKHEGPPFADGDFLKWFEGVAQVYAVTKDPSLDQLMDRIIVVLKKSQREDGYFGTQTIIPQRQGDPKAHEFEDRDNFETYNMGHLMTAACVHYRATGKTTMLEMATKAADYLYGFYQRASPELARNAICPSHYMGVVELYRTTRNPRYLDLAKKLIQIRDEVTDGADQNQDRIPFADQHKAVGHAVRANYLYAGAADVVAETGDPVLMQTLDDISDDVAEHKVYVTGQTGALYDGASPDGSSNNPQIALVHQAYGRDFQLPNLTAYNETCATIGYALWNWRMLEITGEAKYADYFERSLYNGVLPAVSLDGKRYLYVNPLRKLSTFDWPLRWSRTRQPNIQASFCCPPNAVRTIAEAQDYAYSLSPNALWVNLYGANAVDTILTDGGHVALKQETDYPWNGRIKITLQAIPPSPFSIRLRIPGWEKPGQAKIRVNGVAISEAIIPGTYFALTRTWKAGDTLDVELPMKPELLESDDRVEETRNQVAFRCGPLIYCLEANDLPSGVSLSDVALSARDSLAQATPEPMTIAGAHVIAWKMPADRIAREPETGSPLYREFSGQAPTPIDIRLVPYYAWGNRGDTDMSVWLPIR